MLGAASTAALQQIVKAIRARKWLGTDDGKPELTREGMRERAGWHVESAYGAVHGNLTCVAEDERAGSRWEVLFEDGQHRYRVEYGLVDGDLLVTRTRREAL